MVGAVKQWRMRWILFAIALAFLASGMLFVRRLGIEADEAIIANGIYDHGAPWYSWKFGDNEIPVMIISYMGALKTWIYNLIFLFVRPGVVSLRLPVLLLGALTVCLFFEFLDQSVGRRAAWIGTALLATDTSYVLLTVPDFGPLALQFVFKLSALILLLRFHRTGSERALATAFCFIGLALWDKAVFLWVLFGLSVAVLVVFPRAVLSRLTVRNALIAGAAVVLGALPLIIYNLRRPLETLRLNAKIEEAPVLVKAAMVKSTMDGSVLFGFLTALEPGPKAGAPRHWNQSLSLWLADVTRHPRSNLIVPASILSLLSLLILWRSPARKPILFGAVTCGATWLPMALTAGAGAAAQHVVLLWPFQFLVIAAALARANLSAAVALTVLLVGSNLALTNQYYADLIRNGPALRWTDATDELKQYLSDSHSTHIFIVDWGFAETLNLLSLGEMPVYFVDTTLDSVEDRMIVQPHSLFVSHAPGIEYWPKVHAALDERARRDGYEEDPVTTILDRSGRPTYQVFRFKKTSQ